jgi:hypothetical protein
MRHIVTQSKIESLERRSCSNPPIGAPFFGCVPYFISFAGRKSPD